MDLGWGTVIQAVILCVCTWYMRSGAAKDRDQVVRSTAAQSTSNDILTRVTRIETDLELVKKATVAVDDRGPARQA
jgi:hypothetical protein